MKSKGSKYHPPRIGGRQKLIRKRAYEEHLQKKKKKNNVEPIDMDKDDWSLGK